MLNKRTWQVSDWNTSLEQMQQIATDSGWNFCLCQGFEIVVDGRQVFLLNDSNHADPIHYFQEYAAVVVLEKQELSDGRWHCKGLQIESLTVNMKQSSLLDLLRSLGDPTKDCGNYRVEFTLERGEKHHCGHCA